MVLYSIPTQNSDLQLKLARSRNQSMREIDQGLMEKSDKWAKEKKTIMDEKKVLQAELDKVCVYSGTSLGPQTLSQCASLK